MKCPKCDCEMNVRASFPANQCTIYMDAVCQKCGAVYIGKLEKQDWRYLFSKNSKIWKGGQYGGQAVLKTVAGKTVAGSNPVPSEQNKYEQGKQTN